MRISDWSSDVCSSDLECCPAVACLLMSLCHARSTSQQPSSDSTEADDSASSAQPAPMPSSTQSRSKAKFDPWQQDILLRWLIEHEDHPYPKPQDKEDLAAKTKIGRASCRARVCQNVSLAVVAVSLQKKKTTNTIL